MNSWNDEKVAEQEWVPVWLVTFSQMWAANRSAHAPEEYQQLRRLARLAKVPPCIIAVRMFRDTYHVHPTTTRQEFLQVMKEQMEGNGGELVLRPSQATPVKHRAAVLRQLEAITKQAAQQMEDAIRDNDQATFQRASEEWGRAQQSWLMISQQMTKEKARAVLVGFSLGGELSRWIHEDRAGPPPSVFVLYTQEK